MRHFLFLRMIPPDCGWGGCEQNLLDYFERVDYAKYKITLATTKDVYSARLKEKGLPVNVVDFPFDAYHRPRNAFVRIFKFLLSLRPNAVIFVQGAFTDFKLSDYLAGLFITMDNVYAIEVLGAPLPKTREVMTPRRKICGVGLWRLWVHLKYYLRGRIPRRVLTVSEEVSRRLIDWYGYPAESVSNVYHGIDHGKFHADNNVRKAFREKHAIPVNDIVIISSARLSREKSIDRLINAFDRLAGIYPNIWLLIVGEGPDEARLKKLAQSKTSAPRMKFVGFQDDVSPYLMMSDIYVLPSDIEGLGIAVIEAMAAELICVATKTPGPAEIIEDSVNGFLVETSEEGVLQGLEKALRLDNGAKTLMRKKARDHVVKNFDIEKRCAQALTMLRLM